MSKKGFTLIELLVVISIVAIASVGSIMVFDKSNTDSNRKELVNKFARIQRAGLIYLDLNDSWRKQFNNKGYVQMKLFELQNENFIETDLYNDVTFDDIDNNSMIIIYSTNIPTASGNREIVDTCLVDENFYCLANSNGGDCNCCQYLSASVKTINGNNCLN